jgi:uncharacterized Rmd1/YagE family protein
MIMSVGHYPTDLARRGKIGVERKEIYRKMGALFLHKTQFNLNSDILDIPEFFWEYPDIVSITCSYLRSRKLTQHPSATLLEDNRKLFGHYSTC